MVLLASGHSSFVFFGGSTGSGHGAVVLVSSGPWQVVVVVGSIMVSSLGDGPTG